MTGVDLREAWADLLTRRAAFAGTLTPYGRVIEGWARAAVPVKPATRTADQCRSRWSQGVPLLTGDEPPVAAEAVEDVVSGALAVVAAVRPDAAESLDRFAEAWDQGRIGAKSLYPQRGRVGALDDALAMDPDIVGFIALTALRPLLQPYFVGCQGHLRDGDWALGVCPFCGAPPGFGDVLEDGRRRLACHLCGGGWTFTRLACPFCATADTKDLARLEPETTDQGYFISVCKACRAYLKELDRRVRWNGGPALVEDWGSPHFDLVAERQGYWRPLAPLIVGQGPPSP